MNGYLQSKRKNMTIRKFEVQRLSVTSSKSFEDIVQILGISTAAVKARMFHARVALHRMPALKDMGGVKSAERQLLA
jgi:hypothetical protein